MGVVFYDDMITLFDYSRFRGPNSPWIKIYQTFTDCKGELTICVKRCKNPMLAARFLAGSTSNECTLTLDDRDYGPCPLQDEPWSWSDQTGNNALKHILHCIDLHQAFYNER